MRKKCSREQGWGAELHASHEPGMTSNLLNFKDAGGDRTTHKVSVKAVRHTKRHREIEHAESMLRQSVFSTSNKGVEVEQPRQTHKSMQGNTEMKNYREGEIYLEVISLFSLCYLPSIK